MYEEKKEGNVLMVNEKISGVQMEQHVAIVTICRLVVLKRMPAGPLTLLVAYGPREQVKPQVQSSGKMKN